LALGRTCSNAVSRSQKHAAGWEEVKVSRKKSARITGGCRTGGARSALNSSARAEEFRALRALGAKSLVNFGTFFSVHHTYV